MKRIRFKTRASDIRPLKDMIKELNMPWWCTGESAYGDYSIIVCYLPDDESLFDYWDDAYDIESEDVNEIKFTDRFPKPRMMH